MTSRPTAWLERLAVAVAALCLATVPLAASASAHVLPTSTVALDVRADQVDAHLRIPLSDLEAASGIDLGAQPQAGPATASAELISYLSAHFRLTSADGAWTVQFDDPAVSSAEDLGTGVYDVLTVDATLTPPTPADEQFFDLGYDVVVHRLVTHVVLVSVATDWSTGQRGSPREIGTIQLDTVTNQITPLTVDLGAGSSWSGFTSMVSLGVSHIATGTDHPLFLLTLLLPAPLLALCRRWAGAAPPRRAARRIAAITLSFTVGHSITLAVGAMGVPVPQQTVEAMIAVSILVAAAHAIRPLFPGREAMVAGCFGLVHGMAFSVTLSELGLTGGQMALSLLGFNIGIELMQLAVVALVLPALVMLARTRIYGPLRIIAAILTAAAALGWLFARVGVPNSVAAATDSLGAASLPIVVALWLAAAIAVVRLRRRRTVREPAAGLTADHVAIPVTAG